MACAALVGCGGGHGSGADAGIPSTCGNGKVDTGETCDDGNRTDDGNGCSASCQKNAVCGDGIVQSLYEQCDDGNTVSGDGCEADCTLSCGNGTLDPVEACDGTPGCDPTCGLVATGLDDFDVAGDGSVFVVSSPDATGISGRCFGPDGKITRDTFSIRTFDAGETLLRASVAVARTSKTAFVTWESMTSAGTQVSARLFDGACQPITGTFSVSSTGGEFATAIDQAGQSIVAWRDVGGLMLRWYSAAGADAGDLTYSDCGTPGVAMSAMTSAAVVTCTDDTSRISWMLLDGTHNPLTSFADLTTKFLGGAVGMNDGGAFAIERVDPVDLDVHADLFATDGSALGTIALGPAPEAGGAMGPTSDRIQTSSGDFLVAYGAQVWRVALSLVLNGCDQVPSGSTAGTIRTGGGESELVGLGDIQRGILDYGRWNRCTAPTCGNSTVDPGEQCDDGNLISGDGCDDTCRTEKCGDGVVTGSEACDDGNTKSGDGCSATCALESPAAIASPIAIAHDDYDVDMTGALATIAIAGPDVDVNCYDMTHAPLRAAFPIPTGIAVPTHAGVWRARTAGTSLAVWQLAGDSGVHAELLDTSCLVKRAVFSLPITGHTANGVTFDAALDASGRSVVAAADDGSSQIGVAFMDANGFLIGAVQTIPTPSAPSGVHLAMNQATGAGVVLVETSDQSVYYRRFTATQTWQDPDFVAAGLTGAAGMSCTVGMNDTDQFVALCRAADGSIQAMFFDSTGTATGPATVSVRARSGESLPPTDAYGRLHEKIPLSDANFVLGESYGTGTADTSIIYRVYSPAGAFVSSYESSHGMPNGVSARLDGNRTSWFSDGMKLFFGTGQIQ
jgi:cysteine-rich repeat protein